MIHQTLNKEPKYFSTITINKNIINYKQIIDHKIVFDLYFIVLQNLLNNEILILVKFFLNFIINSNMPSTMCLIKVHLILLVVSNVLAQASVANLSSIETELANRQQKIIQQAQLLSQRPSLSASMQSIFSKLPQTKQLDYLILTVDSFGLLKTVQQAIQTNLTCEQKASYLYDLYGRLRAGLYIKNDSLIKLNSIIDQAKKQKERLTGQLNNNNILMSNLAVQSLQQKLKQRLSELLAAYSNFNEADSKIYYKLSEINASQSLSKSYISKADQARQQLSTRKVQLGNINTKIKMLEQQLADENARKSLVQASILSIQQNLKKLEDKQAQQQINSKNLQLSLAGLQRESDQAKKIYKIMEISIQRIRSQIQQKHLRLIQYKQINKNIQDKIKLEENKIDIVLQNKLVEFIKNLRSIIFQIQQKIDQFNYRCNQARQLNIINLRSKQQIIYLITPRDFIAYIRSSYQIDKNLPNLQPIKLSMSPIGILDKAWTEAYGDPYYASQIKLNNQLVFDQDFTCINPSGLETGTGIISKIASKFIYIEQIDINTGLKTVLRLNLAACTRIESSLDLPKIGQTIYFRGKKVSQDQCNVHKVTCI